MAQVGQIFPAGAGHFDQHVAACGVLLSLSPTFKALLQRLKEGREFCWLDVGVNFI